MRNIQNEPPTGLFEDEWVKDVSVMIVVWFAAVTLASALLLFFGFWA